MHYMCVSGDTHIYTALQRILYIDYFFILMWVRTEQTVTDVKSKKYKMLYE